MGLTSALNVGMSGLKSNQKWSEITARNISNANTDGYVKKTTQFSTRSDISGGGVYVSEIRREVDSTLNRMFRYENSKLEKEKAIYEGIEEYTAILGQPGDAKSSSSKLSEFKSSLINLANTPSSSGMQRAVVTEAQNLTKSLNDTSYALDQLRTETQMEIKYEVSELNDSLYRLQKLNSDIMRLNQAPEGSNETLDEISRVVDKISSQLNIRVTQGVNGRVNIFTGGGTPLLEDNAVNEVTAVAGPTSTLTNPTLRLQAGGIDITPEDSSVRGFEHGRLAGLARVQNNIIPKFQLQLDEFARSLIEGFENTDNSVTTGNPGLFTDNDNSYNAANLEGLAGRIKINDNVLPERGGALWRIRDGVETATKGAASDSTQINRFLDFFSSNQTFDPNTELPSSTTIESYANNMVASQQTERTAAEDEYSAVKVTADTIEASRLSMQGVNIDEELQKLMIIEQSYGANSQLMKTVSNMMDTLISIA
jgi:flagellar hook-associated protein 1 FlgK